MFVEIKENFSIDRKFYGKGIWEVPLDLESSIEALVSNGKIRVLSNEEAIEYQSNQSNNQTEPDYLIDE